MATTTAKRSANHCHTMCHLIGIYQKENVISLPVSSLTLVPSMPIISDPQLFLQIFENRPTPNRAVRKNAPNRRINNYATDFQNRCSSGDNRLSTNCRRIILERFGYDNRQLVLSLFDHFKSNANWRELSMIYRMDRYVSHPPNLSEDLLHPPVNKADKLWADVWEAEWDVIFEEREMFNDSLGGIYSISLKK
jgi:hypothetical protein